MNKDLVQLYDELTGVSTYDSDTKTYYVNKKSTILVLFL